jgi:hypothetical protein
MNIFSGKEKRALLDNLKNKHSENKTKKPWWILPAQTLGTIILLFLIGYYIVFTNVETFVSSLGSNYHWMLGWGSGIISFVIAAMVSKPIYFSLGRAFLWRLNQRDVLILVTCIALVFTSSYLNRNKFFEKGVPEKEICAALLPGDMPTVKGLGLGAEEGLTCIGLTRKEASLALAIDRSKIPKEINPKSLFDLEALEPFSSTGAIAIYVGDAKGSDLKIYDGPGFNPRRLGILLPITEDQLIAYKAAQRVRLLGEENAKRVQREEQAKIALELIERRRLAAEAEAKAALELLEKQRAIKEAEIRKVEQERLAAEAAEQRRLQAETQRIAEEKRKEEKASKDRSDWWSTLFIFIGIAVVGVIAAGPIGLGIGVLLLLIFLSR